MLNGTADVERFRGGHSCVAQKQFDVDIELHVSWSVSLEPRQFDVYFQLLEQHFSHLIWAFCWGQQKGFIYCWAALRATLRTASLHLKGIGMDAKKHNWREPHCEFWRCRYLRVASHQARHQAREHCLQRGMSGAISSTRKSAERRCGVRSSRPHSLCLINLWAFM